MTTNAFFDQYGPAALVTGASSGIGKSFAQLLAAKGFDLVLVARRVDRLDALAAQLQQQYGINVKVLQIDLADPSAAQQILDATASLDIGLVISNAGFGFKGAYSSADAKMLQEMLAVNSNMPMLLPPSGGIQSTTASVRPASACLVRQRVSSSAQTHCATSAA